jgi:hypothetical protein
MARRSWYFLFLVGIAWSAAPTAAWSQERRYAAIPFNGDPVTLLRQRLIQAQRLDDLLRQAEKFKGLLGKKLMKGGIDISSVPKWNQPNVDYAKLADTMRKQLVDGKTTADIGKEVKQLQEINQEIKKEVEKIRTGLETQQKPPEQVSVPEKAAADPPATSDEFQDRMSRWALDMLKGAEETKVGGMIQESPTWNKAIAELKEFIANPGSKGKSWDLGMDKLSLPEGLDAAFSKTWERIQAMEMPSLPKIDLSAPELGVSQLSKLPVPRRWTVDPNIWWVGVAVCAGLILWQFWKHKSARRSAMTGRKLGPWPVHPGRVTSAAELIAAFEYLAALRVGVHVRSWNHRAVATELGREGDERRRAAGELAALYEQARYSPEQLSLSAASLVTARHDLCFLAGVALP